jgi:SAM-dependent methyltransferase
VHTSRNSIGITMTPKTYQDNFFDYHLQDSINSAEEILPLVLDFINPKSVIDVGCGVGTWLTIWKKYGVTDVLGVDGEYVDKNALLIPTNEFVARNLDLGYKSDRKYNLATCLEVAEHIHASAAEQLVNCLCDLSDVVLFSAAVPGQEGTLHVNEQYPTYWLKYFEKNGFVPVDCFRKLIWSNPRVSVWYRQNLLLYVRETELNKQPKLKTEAENTDVRFLDVVHPLYFDYKSHKASKYEEILTSPKNTVSYFIKKFLLRKAN